MKGQRLKGMQFITRELPRVAVLCSRTTNPTEGKPSRAEEDLEHVTPREQQESLDLIVRLKVKTEKTDEDCRAGVQL